MSLNCWCNVSTSSKLPNLYKVHNETPADQHFTSNRRSVVRNSVLVLFLDDSELPVVYAWVCVPAPFLCRHFPNKKRHSLSQEVIIHSVISWGVFFFFSLHKRKKSLTQTHRLQPGAFLLYTPSHLPEHHFECYSTKCLLLLLPSCPSPHQSCRLVSEEKSISPSVQSWNAKMNILSVGELTSWHGFGLN